MFNIAPVRDETITLYSRDARVLYTDRQKYKKKNISYLIFYAENRLGRARDTDHRHK